MPVTALYAGILGLMLVLLSIRVVMVVRLQGNVGYGDSGQERFTRIIRTQGNFIEYVPIALVLMGIVESTVADCGTWVHVLGIALVVGRVAHALGLRGESETLVLRASGAVLTLLAIAGGSGLAIYGYIV